MGGLELRVRHRSKRQRARALRVLQGTTQQGRGPCKVAVTRELVCDALVATVDPQSQQIHEQEPVHAFPEPDNYTKGACMPEQVADLGVDDFNCLTTDTSDSASEEVEADMPAGEADVLPEPSESDPACEMFYGRELLLAHRVLRKRISCGAPGLEQIGSLQIHNPGGSSLRLDLLCQIFPHQQQPHHCFIWLGQACQGVESVQLQAEDEPHWSHWLSQHRHRFSRWLALRLWRQGRQRHVVGLARREASLHP